MMKFNLGTKVECIEDFPALPAGTVGYIVEDYGSGIMIAWDLPHRPYPKDKTPEEVADMWAIDAACPIRDGFDKETELQYLKIYDDDE